MKNYISINDQKIELTDEQVAQILAANSRASKKLFEFAVGDIVKIGTHEMIVMEHLEGMTVLLRKDLLSECMAFGKDNNYDDSNVDKACKAFADEIAAIVGEENIVEHEVDLTADDGLDDFGKIQRRASLFTANQARRYVRILDKHKVDKWWWLATAFSIPPHDEDNWVKCVSPAGYLNNDLCHIDGIGVRPFCILKSTIFVSK